MSLNKTFEVRDCGNNRIDVFCGTGWSEWTRFELKKIRSKVFLSKIGGRPVPQEVFKELCNVLNDGGSND